MRSENNYFDNKSLKTVVGKTADFDELAKDAVAFANTSKGGDIYIGIEDGCSLPPPKQIIPEELPGKVSLRISQLTVNTFVTADPKTAENGGEFILLRVYPSRSTIAGTTDGKYYIRIGDESRPLLPDQLLHLLTDKPSYIWETKATRVPRTEYDEKKRQDFLIGIRSSDRVSNFVKEMADDELLDYYLFTEGEFLTNLGVLWIGKRNDRAKIKYSPAIQFIKYDENGNKVNKIAWDDYSLNPQELIDAIWTQIPDWKEGIEVADGLFRDFIPNYSEKIVRELVTNAIVHKPYTTAGDIFINLYPDRLEIHNPGNLPIGVTPQNILHSSIRRNDHLCKVVNDLKMMEKEGSGYDVMYEEQLMNGKAVPEPREGDDRVIVSVKKLINNPGIIGMIRRVSEQYSLSRKERIALGLIAQNHSMTATEFAKALDLKGDHATRAWLDKLINQRIVLTKGKTRGTEYYINPQVIRSSNFQRKPDLKIIEPHRLRELIYEDIRTYKKCSISEISKRIGPEISRYKIRQQLQALIDAGRIVKEGASAATVYRVKNGGE